MSPETLLVTIELIALTQLDGRVAYVNPDAVVQIEETYAEIGKPNHQFTQEVRCVVMLKGGQYVTVRETCKEVRALFEKEPKP